MLGVAFTPKAKAACAERALALSDHNVVDQLDKDVGVSTPRMVDAKKDVFRAGDPVNHIYKVEVGTVCIYRALPDGRRQVIDFAYPGDLIGLGAIGEHTSDAQALTTTRLTCIPLGALQQAVRMDGAIGLKMCEALSRELLATRELAFTVCQKTAAERLASFLLAIARRNERHGEEAREFVLPMTRNDIADFLGLTIETVSRTFTLFRKQGVIDLAQNVLVTICDHEKLVELSECAGE